MKIALLIDSVIPAKYYGGTQRVVCALGKSLKDLGHQVIFIAKKESKPSFGKFLTLESQSPKIPNDVDIAHFHYVPPKQYLKKLKIPFIITIHGNNYSYIPDNAIFVSKNHAKRHNSTNYVHNGLYWEDYPKPIFTKKKEYFHFLGNGAWKVKNLKGTINIVKQNKEHLAVIGASRLNFKMGFRLSLSNKIKFYSKANDEQKANILSKSKGLIFPVLWDEPFGLAIIESLYYGTPVFGTTKGSLPELIKKEHGILVNDYKNLKDAILSYQNYNPNQLSKYAYENFHSKQMAEKYLRFYKVAIK